MPPSPPRSLKLRSLLSPSAGEEVAALELTLLVGMSVGAHLRKPLLIESVNTRFPVMQLSHRKAHVHHKTRARTFRAPKWKPVKHPSARAGVAWPGAAQQLTIDL